jgi:maltose phosphorylase
MNKYLKVDPWCIIEDKFNPKNQRASESIFSLGNGRMGQRANFEEAYSGDTLPGSYIAGIYYPDKTRVGWWKNGYPEYFAKVLNAPDWTGINVLVDKEMLDLNVWKTIMFSRVLNMKEGTLSRAFSAENQKQKKVEVECVRFLSMNNPDLCIIRYTLKPVNFSGNIDLAPYLNGDIRNEDANYDEVFWDIRVTDSAEGTAYIEAVTKKTGFVAGFAMRYQIHISGKPASFEIKVSHTDKYAENSVSINLNKGETVTILKYVAVVSSLYSAPENIRKEAQTKADMALKAGFKKLYKEHVQVWNNIWEYSDIKIDGDTEAQQGIRFNIFQLNQTYRGDDPRLNIGPKGFTGEKYGGSTYWDTEAFCIPFFLSTAPASVTRNLLLYRFKHLEKAIENARKLGFKDGAALYPMVTMNGEECHNEWEITFEEIHRNGAIAYAIYNYINYTGDRKYMAEHGLEVLIGISRFWSQRVSFSQVRKKYVILGVTGPNEYENNVNNNWFTNTIATWCLKYTIESIEFVKTSFPQRFKEIVNKWSFDEKAETGKWEDIIENMHFPVNEELGIFVQQDGYLEKELKTANDLLPEERPINQHWSWDRILRSCYIKQADVLQGLFIFENQYDLATIRRNFDFYESRTVHESSLSSCIHSVIASRIRYTQKAYELYLRTSRLDLDDYNNEVREGLHITSMAGTWMAIVLGFGGLRVKNDKLSFNPLIPNKWRNYSFRVFFRESIVEVLVSNEKVTFNNHSDTPVNLQVYDNDYLLEKHLEVDILN